MTARQVRGLYAIADAMYLDPNRLLTATELALRGGARIIQYRDKIHAADERARAATALRGVCEKYSAYFILNDDVELARAVGADGVHLGRDDASLEFARRALGDAAIIGVSCYDDLVRAARAAGGGASYLAFGSFFPSLTKPSATRVDPSVLRAARARFDLPLVAIGGVTPENGGALIAAGADALAVISGVFAQDDVEAAARRYAALFADLRNS